MNIRTVMQREFRRMFIEDGTAACFFIGIPLAYLLLFGILYQGNTVNYIPTVVFDQDQTALSRNLVQAFDDSERFQVVAYVATQEELERYIGEKKAQVSISIPVNFARDIKKGLSAPLLFEVNGSNIIFANTAISAAQDLIGKVYPEIAKTLIEVAGMPPGESYHRANPVEVGIRVLNNPTFGYTNFLLIGLGVYALQLGIMLTVGPLVNREYKQLTVWKGTATSVILLGKMLVYWICGLIVFIAYALICFYLFHLPFHGTVVNLLWIGSSYVFTVAALGCLIGTIAPDEVFAAILPLLYIMPSLLFSGYIWPQTTMNTFGLVFSLLVPVGYAADNMRDLMLNGYAPQLFHNTMVLYVAGVVLLTASGGIFNLRRRKSRPERGAAV